MPLNSYVTLGRSGLRVSPLCLGTMTFGQGIPGFGASVEDSEAILSRYLEEGGNFLDTANGYTRGQSEDIIGDFFKAGKGQRDRIVLASKFFINMFPGDPNGGGAGRKAIITQCEDSLRRLKTDYLDLYYLHIYDRFTPIEETMAALDTLVQSGKVRYIGISDTPAWKVAQAQVTAAFRGWTPLVAMQVEYSLMQRTIEGEHVPLAQELGLGILPWSPLKGGRLSGKYTRENQKKVEGVRANKDERFTDKQYDIIDALLSVAKDIDATPASVALAWVRAQPGVTAPITGVSSLAQLDANLEAFNVTLTSEQIERLSAVSVPDLNFPANMLKTAFGMSNGGTSVNGLSTEPPAHARRSDQ